MKRSELDDVAEFQNLVGNDLPLKPQKISDVNPKIVSLNKRLIVEELTETAKKGCAMHDIVEIADGCADSLYVIAHAINQLGRVNNAGRNSAAHILLCDAIQRIELSLGIMNPNIVSEPDIDKNLAFAEIVIRGIAAVYNIPLDRVFGEVHRSNMTKVWPDGTIHKDDGGKVIKPPEYSKPDIRKILGLDKVK